MDELTRPERSGEEWSGGAGVRRFNLVCWPLEEGGKKRFFQSFLCPYPLWVTMSGSDYQFSLVCRSPSQISHVTSRPGKAGARNGQVSASH